MDSQQFCYRIHKTSWGIWINMTASLIRTSDVPDSSIKLCENLYVSNKMHWLSNKEKQFLGLGLCLLVRSIDEIIGGDQTLYIAKLEFNECDYQPEGLAMTVAGWIEKYLGEVKKDIRVTFDESSNQYQFTPMLKPKLLYV